MLGDSLGIPIGMREITRIVSGNLRSFWIPVSASVPIIPIHPDPSPRLCAIRVIF